jgi:AcrR family transcriptional regulator
MPKTGPKRDPEAQQRILDAARELICTRGPGRVSINEIAEAAQVGKQTIYRWWPSRSAVVIDALEQMFETASPFPDSGSTYGDIRTQMHRVAASFASPAGAIIRELVAESQSDPTIAAEFRRRFFDERRLRASAVVQRGIERGELRADLDIETVVDALYAPLWLRLLIGHQPLSRRAVDRILDQTWPNLVTPEPSSPPAAPQSPRDHEDRHRPRGR